MLSTPFHPSFVWFLDHSHIILYVIRETQIVTIVTLRGTFAIGLSKFMYNLQKIMQCRGRTNTGLNENGIELFYP